DDNELLGEYRRKYEMRFKHLIGGLIMSACFALFAVTVNAQEFTYKVEQDRTIGHRDGQLIISDKGIEYRAAKRENEDRTWTYEDIKLFEILSPTRVRIWTWKDRKLFLGRDESLTFQIVEGQIDQKVSDFLRERIARPFVTSFVEKEAAPLAEIPVKHSHRFGGCEGTLKIFADRLVYESQTGHDSRSWRWTDIRSIGRSDLYRFDVETFEPQIGASSRSFNFILKEQMPDKTYDLIWSRVYRPTPLIRATEVGREVRLTEECVSAANETIERSDFALAQRAGRGDMQAFEELYRRHNRRVYSLCLRMTRNVTEAEDLAQEVFVLLFRKIGSFRGQSAFTTWLHRLTVNQVLMHWRKSGVRLEKTTDDGETPV